MAEPIKAEAPPGPSVVYLAPPNQGVDLTNGGNWKLDGKTLIAVILAAGAWYNLTSEVKSIRTEMVTQESRRAEVETERTKAAELQQKVITDALADLRERLADTVAYVSTLKTALAAAGIAGPDGVPVQRGASQPCKPE